MFTVNIQVFTLKQQKDVLNCILPILGNRNIQTEVIHQIDHGTERLWQPSFQIWFEADDIVISQIRGSISSPVDSAYCFRHSICTDTGLVTFYLRKKRHSIRKFLNFSEWFKELDEESITYFLEKGSIWHYDKKFGRIADCEYQPVFNYEEHCPQIFVKYTFGCTPENIQKVRIAVTATNQPEILLRAIAVLTGSERASLKRMHIRLLYSEPEQWLVDTKGVFKF